MKVLIMTLALLFITPLAHSVEMAGIHLDEEITAENSQKIAVKRGWITRKILG